MWEWRRAVIIAALATLAVVIAGARLGGARLLSPPWGKPLLIAGTWLNVLLIAVALLLQPTPAVLEHPFLHVKGTGPPSVTWAYGAWIALLAAVLGAAACTLPRKRTS